MLVLESNVPADSFLIQTSYICREYFIYEYYQP